MGGALLFFSTAPFSIRAGDMGTGTGGDRMASKDNCCILLPRPPSQTHSRSKSTAKDVTPNPSCATVHSFWDPSLSSMRHKAPDSVPTTASWSEMLPTQLKVLSPSGPKRQFLPDRAFGAGFGEGPAPSTFKRDLVGETGRGVGSLHTLTWRTPVLRKVSTCYCHRSAGEVIRH